MYMTYFLLVGITGVLMIIYMVYVAHHDTIDYRTIVDGYLPTGFESIRLYTVEG